MNFIRMYFYYRIIDVNEIFLYYRENFFFKGIFFSIEFLIVSDVFKKGLGCCLFDFWGLSKFVYSFLNIVVIRLVFIIRCCENWKI